MKEQRGLCIGGPWAGRIASGAGRELHAPLLVPVSPYVPGTGSSPWWGEVIQDVHVYHYFAMGVDGDETISFWVSDKRDANAGAVLRELMLAYVDSARSAKSADS